jgi:hypothetical protein
MNFAQIDRIIKAGYQLPQRYEVDEVRVDDEQETSEGAQTGFGMFS